MHPFPDQEEESQAGSHAEERHQFDLSNDPTSTDLTAALQALGDLVSNQQRITFRVQSGYRPAVFDGIYKSPDVLQAKVMVFIFQMEAFIGQEGLKEEFETKDHLPVGKKGVNIADLKGLYWEKRITWAFRAWNLLLQQITHMPIVTQMVENGSPSGASRLFKKYVEPQQEADKARLTE